MFLLSKVHTYPNLKFLKHGLKRDARTVIYHNTIYPGPYIFQPIYYHLPANFSCSPRIPNFSVTTHQPKLYPSYTATSLLHLTLAGHPTSHTVPFLIPHLPTHTPNYTTTTANTSANPHFALPDCEKILTIS